MIMGILLKIMYIKTIHLLILSLEEGATSQIKNIVLKEMETRTTKISKVVIKRELYNHKKILPAITTPLKKINMKKNKTKRVF